MGAVSPAAVGAAKLLGELNADGSSDLQDMQDQGKKMSPVLNVFPGFPGFGLHVELCTQYGQESGKQGPDGHSR